jgi:hypothetical protein
MYETPMTGTEVKYLVHVMSLKASVACRILQMIVAFCCCRCCPSDAYSNMARLIRAASQL